MRFSKLMHTEQWRLGGRGWFWLETRPWPCAHGAGLAESMAPPSPDLVEFNIMAFKCRLCDKGPTAGFSYSHSHRATKRVFRPNLQRQKIVAGGKTVSAYVCTDCIKSGRVVRPSR